MWPAGAMSALTMWPAVPAVTADRLMPSRDPRWPCRPSSRWLSACPDAPRRRLVNPITWPGPFALVITEAQPWPRPGGPGILVADACEAAGLLVPELSRDTQAALRAGLPAQAAVGNPVDVVAGTSAGQYGRTMRLLGAADEIDAIIAVFIPLGATLAEDFAREIAAAAARLARQAGHRGLHDGRARPSRPVRGRHPRVHPS
jgi:Ligase-CoA domain